MAKGSSNSSPDSSAASSPAGEADSSRLLSLCCALVWMLGLLTCAAWVGRSFAQENFKVLWPIKVGVDSAAPTPHWLAAPR
jgi:hypothetical protein